MKITITNKKLAPMGYGTWYTGTVDGCWFQAKVYDQPSTFGIHEGRISKLLLRDEAGTVIASYDREWERLPATVAGLDFVQALLDYFA